MFASWDGRIQWWPFIKWIFSPVRAENDHLNANRAYEIISAYFDRRDPTNVGLQVIDVPDLKYQFIQRKKLSSYIFVTSLIAFVGIILIKYDQVAILPFFAGVGSLISFVYFKEMEQHATTLHNF